MQLADRLVEHGRSRRRAIDTGRASGRGSRCGPRRAARTRRSPRRRRGRASAARNRYELRRPARRRSHRRSTCCTPCGRASASTRGGEHVGVGVLAGDDPGPAGPVQADRDAGLATRRHRAERRPYPTLGRRRAPGGGRRTARMAGAARRGVDESHGTEPAGLHWRAPATSACSTIARAVPSASEPMRNTTVLPLRSTPPASANTLGRPSNTKPTTPSGARRASTASRRVRRTRSTLRARSGTRRATCADRRSCLARICRDSSRRVVDRPRRALRRRRRSLRRAIGANAPSSASRPANSSKKSVISWSCTSPGP